MFWDGTRWVDENARTAPVARDRANERLRRSLAAAGMMVGLIALSLPFVAPGSSVSAAEQLSAAWDVEHETALYQEGWSQVSVKGSWWRGRSEHFMNGGALSARDRGAKLEVSFTGTGIALIGPKSKHRGEARVYLDGTYVTTVDAHSRTYREEQPLYIATFDVEATHTVAVVVAGTGDDSKVSVDAVIVRGKKKGHDKDTPTAPPVPGPVQLTIGGVAASGITSSSAMITWTASAPATGQVEYGTTTAYGQVSTLETSFNYTTHRQTLTGLQPGTTYHFRTTSVDATGNRMSSGDHTFVTLPAIPTPAPSAPPTPKPDPTPMPDPDPTPAPEPDPTSTPRPDPTPTPEPDPTSPPPPTSGRPFPAPVTNRTFTVPAAIDDSGSTDASGQLNAWIKSVPDGSVLEFRAGGIYRIDKGLLLAGRTNLVLVGNGAKLKMRGGGNDEAASAFLLRGSKHIAIRGFTVVGNNPNTSTIFVPGSEAAHVLGLSGWYGGGPSAYVEMSNVSGSHVYGDFVYVEGRNVAPFEPSHDVWVHHNEASYIGRNAVSSINVVDLLVENNRFDKIGYHVWDLEPNFAQQVVRRNTFRGNTVGSYAHMQQHPGYFVSSWNWTGQSRIDDIRVVDNVVAGNPANGWSGKPVGLTAKFIMPNTSNVIFKNNSTSQAVGGPALIFEYVAGVEVTGNHQPLLAGVLARFTNCTGVIH